MEKGFVLKPSLQAMVSRRRWLENLAHYDPLILWGEPEGLLNDMQRRSSLPATWCVALPPLGATLKVIPRGKIVPDHAEIDQTSPTTAGQTIQGRWKSLSTLSHAFEDFELRNHIS